MKLMDRYLEKKEEIIKPALIELETELQKFNYTIKIIDGGISWDLLDQKIAEFGLLNKYALIKLLGQIALKLIFDQHYKDAVVIGFHEASNYTIITNPKDEEPLALEIDEIENKLIKDCVILKLFFD